jgi:hypothetical protein
MANQSNWRKGMKINRLIIGSFFLATCATAAAADHGHNHGHGVSHDMAAQVQQIPADGRAIVHFPDPMRVHILSNMRDHLLALSEIQSALGGGQFAQAADIAEQRLGMSSLELHGAHDASRYMPPAMAKIGSSMHRAASRFATAAQEAEVSGDTGGALKALSVVTQQCVACHAGFRVQ